MQRIGTKYMYQALFIWSMMHLELMQIAREWNYMAFILDTSQFPDMDGEGGTLEQNTLVKYANEQIEKIWEHVWENQDVEVYADWDGDARPTRLEIR